MSSAHPPLPSNETQRLDALRRYTLLDAQPDEAFDDIARLAALICDMPIALVNLIGEDRQWSKARIGLDMLVTPREQAFCSYTILGDELLAVADATKDERFAENPLVTHAPNIRSYLGAPLIDQEGFALGALCVLDRRPREFGPAQREGLQALARLLAGRLQQRRMSGELAALLSEVKVLQELLPICCYCKGIRDDVGYWQSVESYMGQHAGVDFTHSICPTCFAKHYPELFAKRAARRQAESGEG